MIHPTAIISPLAQLAPDVEVGAYAVIEGPVQLGAGCRVAPHAQIVGDTVIGEGTVIGRGAVIGEDPQDLGFKPETRSGVRIGANNTIREHVTIHRGSKDGSFTVLGDGNFIMVGAHFGHDVKLGNRNIIANAVLVAGHVHFGHHTFVGGGAVFHQFLRVGDYCVIQGNSSFSKDVPHYCAAGRTNLIMGMNVIGMRRQGFSTAERGSIKELFDLIYRSGRNLSQAVEEARTRVWPERAEHLLRFFEAPSKKGVGTVRNRGNGDED